MAPLARDEYDRRQFRAARSTASSGGRSRRLFICFRRSRGGAWPYFSLRGTNKEKTNYAQARSALIAVFGIFENTYDIGLDSVRFVSSSWTADQVSTYLSRQDGQQRQADRLDDSQRFSSGMALKRAYGIGLTRGCDALAQRLHRATRPLPLPGCYIASCLFMTSELGRTASAERADRGSSTRGR